MASACSGSRAPRAFRCGWATTWRAAWRPSAATQSIGHQGTYQTGDGLPRVRAWYAEHFHIPASADNVPQGGDCLWFSRTKRILGLEYSVSVLACSLPPGTQITLNDSVGLGP